MESAVCQRRQRGWKVRFQVQLQLMAEHMQAWVWRQQQLLSLPLNEALESTLQLGHRPQQQQKGCPALQKREVWMDMPQQQERRARR